MRHVFIVGSKGIPANYGGFETFVDQLVSRRTEEKVVYHVACMGTAYETFDYKGAECFQLKVPPIGPAKAIAYDVAAFRWSLNTIKNRQYENAIIYVLACRIGPFMKKLMEQARELGVTVFVNPDGHEWKRSKWSPPVRAYWKYSESGMVRYSHGMICDSKNMELYIQEEYRKYSPLTTFIPYGADLQEIDTTRAKEWLKERFGLQPGGYALIVGRFVPENNYEIMIEEYLEFASEKPLLIISNVDKSGKLYTELDRKYHLENNPKIIFAGTVYDTDLLRGIRAEAFVYLHGHQVGGTNPSLLEALADTKVNLLYDVSFNREVAEEAALYWTGEKGSLVKALEQAEGFSEEQRLSYESAAKERIRSQYSWEQIVNRYEEVFLTADFLKT